MPLPRCPFWTRHVHTSPHVHSISYLNLRPECLDSVAGAPCRHRYASISHRHHWATREALPSCAKSSFAPIRSPGTSANGHIHLKSPHHIISEEVVVSSLERISSSQPSAASQPRSVSASRANGMPPCGTPLDFRVCISHRARIAL